MARPERKSRPRILSAVLAAIIVVAVMDLLAFRARVERLTPPKQVAADGIVVLTGGSGMRIAEGLRLLEAGHGTRLLISGVNPSIGMDEVSARVGGAPDLFACCVDLGYRAESTLGNGGEAADWARANGFQRLAIVTSDYHMPRTLLVLGDAMPGRTLVAVPVRTRIDPARTFTDPRSFRGVVREWAKWRVTTLVRLARHVA